MKGFRLCGVLRLQGFRVSAKVTLFCYSGMFRALAVIQSMAKCARVPDLAT